MEILGVDELHLDLRNYLDDIETNAGLVRGSIQSRQVVALAIVNYLDRKELMRQIKLLQKDVDRLQGNTGANEGWTDWRIS
jgi:predicted lipid carrier protein YhbT